MYHNRINLMFEELEKHSHEIPEGLDESIPPELMGSYSEVLNLFHKLDEIITSRRETFNTALVRAKDPSAQKQVIDTVKAQLQKLMAPASQLHTTD